ncbi:acyltransferase family protein [Cronobacter malonaticus]|uniref:acyltransferase family protein n=1 Tax=Cronobacter malonaticus TaxID=413503 RepID=UPI002233EC5E|nr:acyltransferase [Cronobacter malonaticus]
MEAKKELHGLTIFRFVAAFYVFIFHCNIRYGIDFRNLVGIEANDYIIKFLKNGAVGMSFFFVLSGFVLAYASSNGIRKDYFLSRIARIYPAYIALGIITLPFIFMYDMKHIMAYLALFITSTQSWFAGSFTAWNFSGSWSISTEMFFYVTFPFLFPIIKKNPYTSLTLAIIASSLISPISSIVDSK